MTKTETGKVKFFRDDLGYGFIIPDSGGDDVMIHHTGINSDEDWRSLRAGDLVEFETRETEKGVAACNCTVVGRAPDRRAVLLRAAYDILKKCGDEFNPQEVTAFYDGTDCDGFCLMEDIACELDLPDGAEPLEGMA